MTGGTRGNTFLTLARARLYSHKSTDLYTPIEKGSDFRWLERPMALPKDTTAAKTGLGVNRHLNEVFMRRKKFAPQLASLKVTSVGKNCRFSRDLFESLVEVVCLIGSGEIAELAAQASLTWCR